MILRPCVWYIGSTHGPPQAKKIFGSARFCVFLVFWGSSAALPALWLASLATGGGGVARGCLAPRLKVSTRPCPCRLCLTVQDYLSLLAMRRPRVHERLLMSKEFGRGNVYLFLGSGVGRDWR